MSQVKKGDTVHIHYTGTLQDGSVFDSSEGRDPLSFTVGSGQIIPGLDAAMEGMSVGDTRRVEVPSDQAYGPVQEEARQAVPRADIPEEIPMEVGTQVNAQNQEGQVMTLTIHEITDEQVVLDANHPLAGKDLIFDVELVSIG
ncbi:FKBP-type peptidyl-prolyl cis-trans isomerase [Aquicoccus porphyridii]|uniref:Peptidyl-prolyl cis-trans isomerase n=1 Tax=Aquicoccus porphyridii TaxID=1852029 RepID=A0A5A9ZTG0_9RHOB|nr:peptidylprolyl isomerase [Aquicoccus porphyridii]KAA0920419.1 peptidylprolyl isomerase [Aquicoccus porphyridii]RAI54795.1 peptidylprolyl isomerase [Rhodobacteraceae bacterium AsT-22]